MLPDVTENNITKQIIFADELINFVFMDKKEKKDMPQTDTQPRPNRDAYKKAFSEDYPDMDFEDKEARYGRMLEDRNSLRSYRKSGAALNGLFENQRWLAAMVSDLMDNPDLNPIEWLADNGIDLQEVMNDEETRKKVADKIAEHQKKVIEDEQENEQRQKNIEQSWQNLAQIGVDEAKAMEMWNKFFTEIIDPALRGEVTTDTWRAVQRAANYDSDIAAAREQAGMQARNEKMENKVKKFDSPMPPTLTQAQGQQATPRNNKPKNDFWQSMKEAGY